MSLEASENPTRDPLLRRVGVPLSILALAALVILLSAENRRLEKALDVASARSTDGLAVGDVLPAFEVASLDGRMRPSVVDGERRSLLFFFTTSCAACDQNLESWLELHRRYGEEYQVTAVGLDSPSETRDYAREREMPFEVVTLTDPLTIRALGLKGVPETVLVGQDGRVSALHLGLLPDEWDQDWS